MFDSATQNEIHCMAMDRAQLHRWKSACERAIHLAAKNPTPSPGRGAASPPTPEGMAEVELGDSAGRSSRAILPLRAASSGSMS